MLNNEFKKKFDAETNNIIKTSIKQDFLFFMKKMDSIENTALVGALLKVRNIEDLGNLNLENLGFGIALALLSSAIPFSLEMKALGQLPSRTFSILMSLEPAAASICAFIFLNEYLTFYEILAVICVVIASAGTTLTSKKEPKI